MPVTSARFAMLLGLPVPVVLDADDVVLAEVLPTCTSMTLSGTLPQFSMRCSEPTGM
jgi:hypothetical protein